MGWLIVLIILAVIFPPSAVALALGLIIYFLAKSGER